MVSTNLFWKNSENKEPKTSFQTFEANVITICGAKFCNKTELWRNLLIQWNDTPNVDCVGKNWLFTFYTRECLIDYAAEYCTHEYPFKYVDIVSNIICPNAYLIMQQSFVPMNTYLSMSTLSQILTIL